MIESWEIQEILTQKSDSSFGPAEPVSRKVPPQKVNGLVLALGLAWSAVPNVWAESAPQQLAAVENTASALAGLPVVDVPALDFWGFLVFGFFLAFLGIGRLRILKDRLD
jgi:hypothetical protein